MKFYCLIVNDEQKTSKSYEYLEQAVRARNVEFVPIVADTFDHGQDMQRALETPSILYRIGTGKRAMLLESLLVRPGVTTFYSDIRPLFMRGTWGPTVVQQNAGLPVIPTIFNIDRTQEEKFADYVERLGGFPVVLKSSGGSHGSGVMRVDSLESLRSVVGFTAPGRPGEFALRKYIHDATHLRLVVIGDQVVDAIRYLPQPGDFRTNAVAVPQVEAYPRTDKNSKYFELAVKTVAVEGLEFGGIDLLVTPDGTAYIAELNFPCNFSRNQMNTGIDVAGAMVDYLVTKAS